MPDQPTATHLQWDDLKPAQIYSGCSNQTIDMACRRTRLRHNLHGHCQEILNNPDRYFHPIWYNLREDRSVDRHMRKIIEQQMLKDILDAITLHDVYTGSVSVFFSHNGHLPPGVASSPQSVSPVSYITPRILQYRTNMSPPESVPFALLLETFIYAFAIPHVQMYERVSRTIGYLHEPPQTQHQSIPLRPQRKWPSFEEYSNDVAFYLPGWSMNEIPSNVSLLLEEIFPMFISDPVTMVPPSPSPMRTRSSHFNLTKQMSRMSFGEHHGESSPSGVHPIQDETFRTDETTVHTTSDMASTTDEDVKVLRARIVELEAENIRLKESLRTSEEIIDSQLGVSEAECRGKTSPFGPKTTTFLLDRGLRPETNSIFWELMVASPDQQQWRPLLADLFRVTNEDLEALLAALNYDFALIRLRKASAPLGGAQALSNVQKY